ncbi:MAG: hypothetical protein CMN78_06425 [Spirochaetales bacterium]|nr:hypothetical protein [Spirochaetales bacterium]
MTKVGKCWYLLVICFIVALFVPTALFAMGDVESIVTQGEVVELIESNQVDVLGLLQEACGACHGGDSEYPVAGAQISYSHSGHYLGWQKHGQNSWYANGRGCQQCHTNEGFIEYVNTGKVEGYVDYPSQPGCFSCHDSHNTGDFSLRTTKPVTLASGNVYDIGDGNLCASCHLSRRAVGASVKAGSLSSHFGPHHGPQADIVMGANGYEYPGKSYSSSVHAAAIENSCVECHLALPEGRYSLSPEVGGHSFYLKGEVHGSEKLNLPSCSGCHEDVGQEGEFFDIAADGDFDNDGTAEPVQAEVEGLLHMIVNSEGTGVLQNTDPPAYNADGSWNSTRGLEFPIETVAAVWNYKFMGVCT